MTALGPMADDSPPLQPETAMTASADDKRKLRRKPIMSAGTG
jgi:two-component system cell cycle sensor histidine kinase PleC